MHFLLQIQPDVLISSRSSGQAVPVSPVAFLPLAPPEPHLFLLHREASAASVIQSLPFDTRRLSSSSYICHALSQTPQVHMRLVTSHV